MVRESKRERGTYIERECVCVCMSVCAWERGREEESERESVCVIERVRGREEHI